MIHIEIHDIRNVKSNEGILKKIIRAFLELIIPKSNPDFDKKMQSVVFWLIEFENALSIPCREIGLDNEKRVIVKMPFRNNYGYWIDNDLNYQDFIKDFDSESVSQDYFEQKWSELS
jgi:hypothetical protein